MKLLCISYALPPIHAPQSMQIGRLIYYLPKDYELYVACGDSPSDQKDEFYSDLRSKFKDCISLEYSINKYLEAIKSRLPVLYKIPDPLKSWNGSIEKKILKKWGSEKFDAIITFAYPFSSHLVGAKLKKHFNTKWIAHFSDPWADNPYSRYDPISRSLNRKMERNVIENADICIFVSQETKQFYSIQYPEYKSKFFVLEHSYDPSFYVSKYKKNKKFTLRYMGNFYGARSPEPVFKAISILLSGGKLNQDNFVFEIFGGGMKVPFLIKKYGLENIVFQKTTVPYAESLNIMRTSDALIVIDGVIKMDSIFLPSKLIDYLGSGRPVLGITPKGGASDRVISKAGGLIADPEDVPGISEVLQRTMDLNSKGKLDSLCPSGEVLSEYSIKSKINELIKIIMMLK
jgi:glycosyltransferase involved in cell wall biosynthesis